MMDTDYLIHAESFEEYYKNDLKYAFSTKIADCLSSGHPFIVLAPEEVASSKYLKKYNAAFVISDFRNIKHELEKFIYDDKMRSRTISNALKCVEKNHNHKKNSILLKKILNK